MADTTGKTHRALLTVDRRFAAARISPSGTNGASYTQAGPEPGAPVRGPTTLAELQASGEQGTETIEVYALRGGIPGSSVPLAAGTTTPALADPRYPAGPGVGWRYSGDPLYRGWDPPTTISAWGYIDYSTTANYWLYPHCVSRSDGRMFAVGQRDERYVEVWTRPRGGSWAMCAQRPYDAAGKVYASPVAACPCLVALPGNRLLCLFWRYDAASPAIHASVSNDDGATWGPSQLVEAQMAYSGYVPYRIRAAYSNGQILMVVSVTAAGVDSVFHFASSDLGSSFRLVNPIGDNNRGYCEVVGVPGGFVLASIYASDAVLVRGYAVRIASAYDFPATTSWVLMQAAAGAVEWGTRTAGAGTALTAGEIALTVDDVGVLWALTIDHAAGTTMEGYVSCSKDGGATWAVLAPAGSGGAWWRSLDASTHPRQLSVCAQGGRLVCVSLVAANPGTSDDSLTAWYLGGSTTVCRPHGTAGSPLAEYQRGHTVVWAGVDLPENTGVTWTESNVNAPTTTLTTQGVRVQHAGVLDSKTWTATPVTTDAQGLEITAAGKTTDGPWYVRLRIATSYEVRVAVTPTQIIFRDMGAGVDLVTVATTAGASATGCEVKLALGDDIGGAGDHGRAQAWYREMGVGADADREFISIGSTSTLVQFAPSGDRIQKGTIAGSTTSDVHIRLSQYDQGVDCGTGQYATANTQVADLLGQPIGPAPYPAGETGVRLAMTDGPVRPGDTWTIPPAYRNGIDRTDPAIAPSPAAKWRNLVSNSAQRIVWTMPEATPPESPLWAVYIDGANIATAQFDGWNGAAWVSLGTIDLRVGTALKYVRAGEIVYCGTGGGSPIADYVERNALAGCVFASGAGATRRKIRTNSGGRWTGAAVTTTRPILVLDSPAAADPAAASDAEIVSPRGAFISRGGSTAYSRYSLYIPAQATLEGYYEIGTILVGPLAILGLPDYSRQLVTETNVETTRNRSGSKRKRQLGSPGRVAQLSWTDGRDGSNVHDSSPDYVTDFSGAGSWPVSTPAAIATDLHGLIAVNDVLPVVYLPVVPVPAAAATVTCITAADLMLYAHIETDTLQTDIVAGDEHTGAGSGEYVRVGTVRLEEVL